MRAECFQPTSLARSPSLQYLRPGFNRRVRSAPGTTCRFTLSKGAGTPSNTYMTHTRIQGHINRTNEVTGIETCPAGRYNNSMSGCRCAGVYSMCVCCIQTLSLSSAAVALCVLCGTIPLTTLQKMREGALKCHGPRVGLVLVRFLLK